MSSEHIYDMTVLEQKVDLRVNWYITHNLIYRIQGGAAKYGRGELDEGEMWGQAYVCYMIGAWGHLCVPAWAFDTEQFYRMDGRRSRTGEGSLVEAYARLIMLHLSEQFPSGEVTRSFLEDICRKDTSRQRNYNVICHEYIKGSLVRQELEHLTREATDSMKWAKNLCQLLKTKCGVKPQVELDQGILAVSLAPGCPGPVIGKRRGPYCS